ncbi:protein kinase domain-containing protein [Streptomyces sp. H27-H5]|uniref:serine/threonine-protein kinase n=1 Tax=Streptomyces sp. H27-H5 TaxID=2996460 RepID=UPI002270B32B|nr:serine/threonine-protein kinase [Streptomyces sp. H27-H5]MCY0956496.1 PQQ-binding-like beta-propeller repeat protein [Streptomyces sp. H27-H5]
MPATPADRSPLAPLTHDDPPHLGDHRLLARLGSGGMGTVYLARSPRGRTVALKTVHARIAADPAFRTRFRLEADAARVMGGRYGAAVFAADALARTPWLATEYVIGPQLDEAVRLGGPLSEVCVRNLGADLALGLGQLHRSDVVHRDLKPSNVMITAEGPKVIDFGIARALGDERLTRVGAATGTPAFMSPEQAGGLDHTPAGDVFALAGVLVFAAAGHGPFGGGQAADLLYRVRYAEPDLTGVPEALLPLLARCLDKDPAGRPTTAELARWLAPAGGVFADGLAPAVLADIARRGAAVWEEPPARLPASASDFSTEPPTVAPPGGTSRRGLLAWGGAAAGTALTGGGLWAWLASRGDEAQTAEPPLPGGPSALWAKEIAHTSRRAGPTRTGDVLVHPGGSAVTGINVKTGRYDWSEDVEDATRVAVDGKATYILRMSTDADKALALVAVPRAVDDKKPPVLTLAAFDGGEPRNQLLCVRDGTAYFHAKAVSGDAWFLLAANLASGKELWREPAQAPSGKYDRVYLLADLTKGGLLVCGKAQAMNGLTLTLRDPATGRQRWEKTLIVPGEPPYGFTADDEHVYFGADALQAVRLTDGGVAWSFGADRDLGNNAQGQRRYGIPAVRNGVVYAAEGGRGLVGVDARTGAGKWAEKTRKDTLTTGEAAPVVGAAYVYDIDTIGLRAVELGTGRPAWRYTCTAVCLSADSDGELLYGVEARKTIALPMS